MKMLVSDYDDTFYINDEDIKRNIDLVKLFIKNDSFAIATGRSYFDFEKKKDIIYIKNIYIEESFRSMGLGKKVINELRKMQYRIELECWYGMPSNELYKSLGAKEIKTRYILEN